MGVTELIQEVCDLRDKWVYKPARSDHVGAWADPDSNLIEIRANHSIRYIDGDGSVEGEFVGFKKLRVKLTNGKTMTANMLHNKQLLLENGEKWTRCTDKGCLIM